MKKLFILFITCALSGSVLAQAGNEKNPYDLGGRLHNEMVKHFFDHSTLPISSGLQIVESLDDYFARGGFSYRPSVFLLGEEALKFAREINAAPDPFDFLVKGGYMSAAGVEFYRQLDGAMDLGSFNECYRRIISIEDLIINSPTIPKEEQDILLMAASVARYSALYWSDPKNTPQPQAQNRGGGAAARFSWGGLGKADLKGAIEGGVAGAIVGGTVATPVGAVPGWVAGAVGWGAGCSVSNAIGQLTGWW